MKNKSIKTYNARCINIRGNNDYCLNLKVLINSIDLRGCVRTFIGKDLKDVAQKVQKRLKSDSGFS